jgi:hypothetical protein
MQMTQNLRTTTDLLGWNKMRQTEPIDSNLTFAERNKIQNAKNSNGIMATSLIKLNSNTVFK